MANRILVLLTIAFAMALNVSLPGQRGAGRAEGPGAVGRPQLMTEVSGSLMGLVRNPSGAVVPGVQVTVKLEHVASVQPNMTITDQDGRFCFTGLPLGTYRLEANHRGFTRTVHTGIAVRLSQTANVSVKLGESPPPSSSPTPSPGVTAAPAPTPSVPCSGRRPTPRRER